MRSRRTGDSYVGAASDCDSRIVQHLRGIRRNNHPNAAIRTALAGHTDADIEVIMLDRFSEPRDLDVRATMFARERHWIHVLKPSLNQKRPSVANLGKKLPGSSVAAILKRCEQRTAKQRSKKIVSH